MVIDENHKYVVKQRAKTSKGNRLIPIMIPELFDALCAVPEENRTGRIVTCYPGTVCNAINRICKSSDLKQIGTHGCRHSFASAGHSMNIPPHEMQLLRGWDDLNTMNKIYTHINDQELLKAENALKSFFQK